MERSLSCLSQPPQTAIGFPDYPWDDQKTPFVQGHPPPTMGAYWGGQFARNLVALGASLDIHTSVGALRAFSPSRSSSGTNTVFDIKLSPHYHALGTRVLRVRRGPSILTLHQVLGIRLIAVSKRFAESCLKSSIVEGDGK